MRIETRRSRGAAAVVMVALLGAGGSAWAKEQHVVQELTFTGTISATDPTAQTFTVKSSKKGEAVEMVFHVDPATKLYVGGEEAYLVAQLHRGETVTVNYETKSPSIHNAKHLKKSA